MEVAISSDVIAEAQSLFSQSIVSQSEESFTVLLGFQGGQLQREVHWIPNLNLWAHFGPLDEQKSTGPRYWNVFGFGRPNRTASIDCEINSPISGLNRRTGGVFLTDTGGRLFLGHRGNLNAGGRIPKKYVFANTTVPVLDVRDDARDQRVLLIGELGKQNFPNELVTFIRNALTIKERFRRG
jgi:hypothetical protein